MLMLSVVALQYARDRQFDETGTNILFYDLGAADLTLSLVNFKQVNDTKKNSTASTKNIIYSLLFVRLTPVPAQVLVLESAWDQSLGSRDFDQRLVDVF